jgi:hypothetical protein
MFYRWVSNGALFMMDVQKWTVERAGVELLYVVHIVAEKKDHTLVQSLMTALLGSPGFLHQTLMEYLLAPIFSSNNGPAVLSFWRPWRNISMFKNAFCHWYFQIWRVSTFVPSCQ